MSMWCREYFIANRGWALPPYFTKVFISSKNVSEPTVSDSNLHVSQSVCESAMGPRHSSHPFEERKTLYFLVGKGISHSSYRGALIWTTFKSSLEPDPYWDPKHWTVNTGPDHPKWTTSIFNKLVWLLFPCQSVLTNWFVTWRMSSRRY